MKKYLTLFIVVALVLTAAVVLLRVGGKSEWPVIDLSQGVSAASAVKKSIDKLPEQITLESEPQIAEIAKAYAALTAEEQAKVSNYSRLAAAESALKQLKDEEAARLVSSAIDKLPASPSAADRAAIESASAAYNALTDNQKKLVLNHEKLVLAQDSLLPAEVDAMISAIPFPVTAASADAAKAARAAYNALTESQKLLCKNEARLSEIEATIISINTDYKENDLVVFVGGNIYEASNAEKVSSTEGKGSLCKITFVNENGLHKYHIISTDGRGVFGWVNAESIRMNNGGNNNG